MKKAFSVTVDVSERQIFKKMTLNPETQIEIHGGK